MYRNDMTKEKGGDRKKNVTTFRPMGIIMSYLSEFLLTHHPVINYQNPQT